MTAADVVLAQIDSVSVEYAAAKERARYDDMSDLGPDLTMLCVRAASVIERTTVGPSVYRDALAEANSMEYFERLPVLMGTLAALRAEVEGGYLDRVSALLHADTFNDFLEMAEELLTSGYKDAAAVVAGTVLESHLRLLCEQTGLPTVHDSGKAKKADTLNSDLARASVYNKLEQKQVTADLGVRNAAAHGAYGDYGVHDVERLIATVRQFVARHPA